MILSEKINIQTIYKSFAIELKQINDNSEFVIKIINMYIDFFKFFYLLY